MTPTEDEYPINTKKRRVQAERYVNAVSRIGKGLPLDIALQCIDFIEFIGKEGAKHILERRCETHKIKKIVDDIVAGHKQLPEDQPQNESSDSTQTSPKPSAIPPSVEATDGTAPTTSTDKPEPPLSDEELRQLRRFLHSQNHTNRKRPCDENPDLLPASHEQEPADKRIRLDPIPAAQIKKEP